MKNEKSVYLLKVFERFNPNNEKMVIVLKDLFLSLMLGEKPKLEFYKV